MNGAASLLPHWLLGFLTQLVPLAQGGQTFAKLDIFSAHVNFLAHTHCSMLGNGMSGWDGQVGGSWCSIHTL